MKNPELKDPTQFARENIRSLKPYSSARDEYAGADKLFFDANENPFGNGIINRYPDPVCQNLREKFSQIKQVPVENMLFGNGADEWIDLTIRVFCEPGQDKILICPPTYGMYRVSADTNNIGVLEVRLDDD